MGKLGVMCGREGRMFVDGVFHVNSVGYIDDGVRHGSEEQETRSASENINTCNIKHMENTYGKHITVYAMFCAFENSCYLILYC